MSEGRTASAGRTRTNPWNPVENPIVLRAFRIGFRPGPGQYPLGWWGLFLGIALAIPFLPSLFGGEDGSAEQVARWMFVTLSLYLLAVFLFGGFQRMITAFSKERERETFDFIHLSTMPSGSIVFGFLVAGQVPGYLLSVFLLPVLVTCAILMGYALPNLLAAYFCLIVYSLFLSAGFLYLGFWAKKVAEFRGAAIVYILLGMFFGRMLLEGLVQLDVVDLNWGGILLGGPLVFRILEGGWPSTDSMPAQESFAWTTPFYGLDLPTFLLPAIVYLPLALLLARTLARNLRHRDRAPWTAVSGGAWLGWILFIANGMWWGSSTGHGLRLMMAGLIAWVVIGFLVKKNLRSRARTLHDLGRARGAWSGTLRSSDGPPFLLGAVLLAVHLFAGVVIVLSPAVGLVPESSAADAALASRRTSYGGSWLALLFFVAPIAASIVWQQWMTWVARRLRPLASFAFFALVVLPYLLVVSDLQRAFPSLSAVVDWGGGLSPLHAISEFAIDRDLPGAPERGSPVVLVLGQVIFIALLLAGAALCRRTGARLAGTARGLLGEIDGAVDEIGERESEGRRAVVAARDAESEGRDA